MGSRINNCVFCPDIETMDHLLFQCKEMNKIWKFVFSRLQIDHDLGNWQQEISWMTQTNKGRHWKARMLRDAFAEVVYAC